MQSLLKEIIFKDGTTNQLRIFENKDQDAPVVLIYPAMGVRASYYKEFAEHLCSNGLHSLTIDWRGHGKSSVRPSRNVDHGFQTLIEDMNYVVDKISGLYPKSEIYLTGHSLGGQIGSLYAGRYPNKIKGLILIAAATPYYKAWKEFGAWKLIIGGSLFYMLSKLLGYYPGKFFGFGGNEAKGIMKDWSFAALNGKYILTASKFDYEAAMNEAELSVLSLAIKKDNLGCKEAVNHLLNKFKKAQIIRIETTSEDSKIENLNHFNWAKQPGYFVNIIKQWINS